MQLRQNLYNLFLFIINFYSYIQTAYCYVISLWNSINYIMNDFNLSSNLPADT